MHQGERNLQVIHLHERPDEHQVRSMLRQVFEAVAYLHELGLAHNDLKLLNLLRMSDAERRIKIIDLDAATQFSGKDLKRLLDRTGAKFSSGCMPPEMFAGFVTGGEEQQHFEAYFASIHKASAAAVDRRRRSLFFVETDAEDKELWDKIKPKPCATSRMSYVVKTFLVDPESPLEPKEVSRLPYELIQASPAVDLWGLGCIMYLLITGTTLEQVSRDDDLTDGASMERIFRWNDDAMHRKLAAVVDPTARDLIAKLLQVDPAKRIAAAEALEHPYFHPVEGIQRSLDEAKQKEADLKAQLEEAKRQASSSGGEASADNAMLQALMGELGKQLQENTERQKKMEESLQRAEKTNNEILAKTDAIDKRTQRLEERTIRIEVRRDLLIFICMFRVASYLWISNLIMIIMKGHHAPDQGSGSAGFRDVEENSDRRSR